MRPSSCDFSIVEHARETNRIYRYVFNEDGRCMGSIDVYGFCHPCIDRYANKHKALFGIQAVFCCVVLLLLLGYRWGHYLPHYISKENVEKAAIGRHVDKLPTDIGYIPP